MDQSMVCMFIETKSYLIPDKLYIGTYYDADYGKHVDHHLSYGFSYLENVAPRSIFLTIWTIKPSFVDNWQNY